MNKSESCKSNWIVLVATLSLALATRLLSFGGISGSDDVEYALLAHQMANDEFKVGQYAGPPVFPLRVGFLLPVSFGFKAIGTNEFLGILWPFLFSLFGIILAFIVGRALLSERAGIIAAAIQALLPIDNRLASLLVPDLIAAFWANIGVFCLWLSSRNQRLSLKCMNAIFCGIALGISWLCKENVLYLLPFIAVYIAWLTRHDKRNIAILFTCGLATCAVFFGEALFYYSAKSDLLFRFHEIERNYEVTKSWFFTEGSSFGWQKGEYWLALLRRVCVDGPRSIFFNENFAYITATALLAVFYALTRRLGHFAFPATWFLSLAFMYNFASSSIKMYQPLILFDRYLYPLLLPATILTAGLLEELCNNSGTEEIRRERRFWGAVLAFGIIAVCLMGIYRYTKDSPYSFVERVVVNVIHPEDVVYTDDRTARVLRFFWGLPHRQGTCNFEGMQSDDLLSGAYVLINRNRLTFLASHYRYELPKFYGLVPRNWVLKWEGNNASLYHISAAVGAKPGIFKKCNGELPPISRMRS